MIVTGTSLTDSQSAIELCKEYRGFLYATVGCHPTRSNEFLPNPEEYLSSLIALTQTNKDQVIAIGECGLDYDRVEVSIYSWSNAYFML